MYAIRSYYAMADMQGVAPGKYYQQYEVAEFESLAGGTMSYNFV